MWFEMECSSYPVLVLSLYSFTDINLLFVVVIPRSSTLTLHSHQLGNIREGTFTWKIYKRDVKINPI